MEINLPEVVAEVTALCAAYNKALIENDVEALSDFFWDSEHALRLGVAEELYGADEIRAFRKARVVNFSDRKHLRETLLTIGQDFASATLEFTVKVNGSPRHGRQSQVWARLPELGWKIVSAHVSHKVTANNRAAFGDGAAAAYVAAASQLLELPIDPEFRDGVVANLDVMKKIAGPLMQFDLGDEEPAASFTA
ncbi:oxalurate catabolism protein HpxZ [Altererythrobacter sp. GH1-8]|uniref:oxalurate catabolism protein HpxZ n=1 Tax=Altererythrobacter sp. GH1-8 TaxID=3349333 RepID=UPI00374D3EBC